MQRMQFSGVKGYLLVVLGIFSSVEGYLLVVLGIFSCVEGYLLVVLGIFSCVEGCLFIVWRYISEYLVWGIFSSIEWRNEY